MTELQPPNLYRATFYNYTHSRTSAALGDIRKPEKLEVSELGNQPLSNHAEFLVAVQILHQDPEINAAIGENWMRTYRPMPPLAKKKLTQPIDIKNHHVAASEENPQYLVERKRRVKRTSPNLLS